MQRISTNGYLITFMGKINTRFLLIKTVTLFTVLYLMVF